MSRPRMAWLLAAIAWIALAPVDARSAERRSRQHGVTLSARSARDLARLRERVRAQTGRNATDSELLEQALAYYLESQGHQQFFRQEGFHRAVVRVECIQGETSQCGSGVVIASDPKQKQGLVLSAAHVFGDDAKKCTLRVVLHDGRTTPARLLQKDDDLDLAALSMDWLADTTLAPLAARDARSREIVFVGGYGMGDYRYFAGPVVSLFSNQAKAPPESLGVQGTTVSGDSGGPMFNHHGEVVGVHWGMQGTGRRGGKSFLVRGTASGRITTFLKKLGEKYAWALPSQRAS